MTRGASRLAAALALLIGAIWFSNLDMRSLIRPDEGRYAEIAREMAATGDWVTPRLNGIKYFEKPPLQYWVTAAAFRAFGPDEWTARLWPALTGALTLLVVWRTGRALFGTRAGDLAGLTAAGMLWMVANAHLNTLDMGLAFWLTAGVAAFLRAQEDGLDARRRRGRMALAWAACAGAVMTKGLVGLVLPGGAIALYLVASRDWRRLGQLHLVLGLGIVLALCAPWFVAVSVANPEFPDFFFVREHFQRYLTPVHRRSEPAWYFVPLFLAGALPWTSIAAGGLGRAWRGDPPEARFRPRLFLLCWCVFVFAFFSASNSKLPSYILPVFPALAWLAGDRLDRMRGRVLGWHVLPLVPLAAVAAVLALGIERYANDRTPAALYRAFQPWILAAAAVMAAGAIAAFLLARRDRVVAAVAALSLGGLVSWQLAITGHDALAPSFSARGLALAAKDRMRADCPMYAVRTYEQTLPFYLGRTMTLVDFRDEMDFGLEIEPGLALPTLEAFVTRWPTQPCAYALVEPAMLDTLREAGLRLSVIARDTRRVIVANPALERIDLP